MNRRPFHVVTSLHDSRTSHRMIDYKARERRFYGTKPFPEIYYLSGEEEVIIAEIVRDLSKALDWKIAAFNCCRDHIHMLVICSEEEIPKIMHRLKGKTARVCNAHRAVKGINPLDATNGRYTPTVLKDKSTPFWTQKYYCKPIPDLEYYWNTVNYINENRVKHGLPDHPKLKSTIESFVLDFDQCFADCKNQ